MKNTAKIHQHYLINTYPFRGKSFERGEGNYLFDDNGKKYLDCVTNFGVNIFGYGNEKISSALTSQLSQLSTLHCSFANPTRANAAKSLVSRAGGKLRKAYFANSGAEAVEAALKFALATSGKNKVVAMINSYHGKTIAALSVTDSKKYKVGLENNLWPVEFAEYSNIKEAEKIIDQKTAAVILEPIQGESGIKTPDQKFLKEIESLCQKNNTLLIVDEIQTGCGRTGKFLASEWSEINPEIVCLGKGLAGGIPVGAVLVSAEIASKIPKALQTSTFGGNPLACAGINAVLELLSDEVMQNVIELGNYFVSELKNISSEKIVEVRGSGLMIGVEVSVDRNNILKQLQNKGILAAPAGENVVRFLPPYTITKSEINLVVKTLESILKNV